MKFFLLVVLCSAGLVSGAKRSACMDASGKDLREETQTLVQFGKGAVAQAVAGYLNIDECSSGVLLRMYAYFMDGNKHCIDIGLNAICMGFKAYDVISENGRDTEFGDLDEVLRSSGDLTHILCQKGELCMSKLKSKYNKFMKLKKGNELKACYNAIKDNRAELLKRAKTNLNEATKEDGPIGTMARIAKGVLARYEIDSENIMEKVEAYDYDEIKEKALSTITKFCDNGCYDDGTVFFREYFELIGDCKPVKFCECDAKDKISTLEYPCCIQSIIDENPEAVDKLKEVQSVVMEVAAAEVSGDEKEKLNEFNKQKKCYSKTYDMRNIDHCEEA